MAALVTPQALAKYPAPVTACVLTATDMVTACAQIAARFYRYPSQALKLVGVTGTNGKTTTSHLIEYFLQASHRPTALLGTLYTRWPGFQQTALHTTPFAPELQQQLGAARDAGNQYAVMEVSSHALAESRAVSLPVRSLPI
jgi:UDP-N-acetylmuramoyl-L-alanyl-D-glutamate--2,6-diaminopimelate ligase